MKNLISVILMVFLPLTLASQTQHRIKIYVYVETQDDDKTEQQIIESHLKRELRALGDIDIVTAEDHWLFRIRVKALGLKYASGRKTPDISIATAVHVRAAINEDDVKVVCVFDMDLFLSTCKRGNLHSWCISLANDLNNTVFAFERKRIWQK